MELSFDEIASQLQPWDLSLKFGDKSYKVRELSNLDLQMFARTGTLSEADAIAKFKELFVGEPPAVETWKAPQFAFTITSCIAYVQTISKKNSEVIGPIVEKTIATFLGASSS